ncbi:MAG: MFS transporter [Desulfobacteraceae bacterium]|nr:MFS transporter [Desulfobacteraceae bacterium]
MYNQQKNKSWKEVFLSFFHKRVITMFFFGFSAGLPILLIFSSLSLWLREAGVERSAVTFFSWAALGYSFKFIWAPAVDVIPVFFLSRKLGRRRGWILFSQFMVILSIILMALTDPSKGDSNVYLMAFAAVLLGFSSATQDIVIDAYRIESAHLSLQAMMASSYIAGYRIGMLTAGAGALFMADFLGSGMGHYNYNAWMFTYLFMSIFMFTGVFTVLLIKEPDVYSEKNYKYESKDYLGAFVAFVIGICGFVSVFYFTGSIFEFLSDFLNNIIFFKYLSGFITASLRLAISLCAGFFLAYTSGKTRLVNQQMIEHTYIEPVKDFFTRYTKNTAILLLMLIGLYRISDIVLGVVSNLFYQDLGFTKTEIAGIVKTFGLFMTIAGGFLGGIFSQKKGVVKILFWGAFFSAVTNLLFMVLAHLGHNTLMLYVVISADNLAAGLAGAAFVAFLSALTSVKFTAVQYAVFSSLMTLIPKLFGGYSGTIVDYAGYQIFFLITAVLGIPVLFLVLKAGKSLKIEG